MSDGKQVCSFVAGGQLFGVEVEKVQEIIRCYQVSSVPLAPPSVAGLINLRGEIVVALDLARRLELEATSPRTKSPFHVVLRTADGPASLLVDEILGVVDTTSLAFEPPPETVRGNPRRFIRGAFQLADRLLLALDIEEVARASDIKAWIGEQPK
jgi:purine-binding chemotaxis protein CheW